MVLFIMLYKVALTLKYVDETLVCDHLNESYSSRSIYQYSDMAPRLLGQTSIFVVFFVSKSFLGIERQ